MVKTKQKKKEIFSAKYWQVSIKDGLSRGSELYKYFNGREDNKHNIFQAQASYYIVNRLSLGVGFTWSTEWSLRRPQEVSFTDFMKGPLIRYQFTASKVSPFLEASYQFGRRNTGPRSLLDYFSSSVHSTLISGGMSIGLTPHLRADASYGLQFKTFGGRSITHHYPQIGISYVFGGM